MNELTRYIDADIPVDKGLLLAAVEGVRPTLTKSLSSLHFSMISILSFGAMRPVLISAVCNAVLISMVLSCALVTSGAGGGL